MLTFLFTNFFLAKANTPVKVKVLRMEELSKAKPIQNTPAKWKRGSGGKGRQPSPQSTSKQAKLTCYFGKKIPKSSGHQSQTKGTQGKHTEGDNGAKHVNKHTGGLEPPFGRLGWSQGPSF